MAFSQINSESHFDIFFILTIIRILLKLISLGFFDFLNSDNFSDFIPFQSWNAGRLFPKDDVPFTFLTFSLMQLLSHPSLTSVRLFPKLLSLIACYQLDFNLISYQRLKPNTSKNIPYPLHSFLSLGQQYRNHRKPVLNSGFGQHSLPQPPQHMS